MKAMHRLALTDWRNCNATLMDAVIQMELADAHYREVEELLVEVRTLSKQAQAVETRAAQLVNRQQAKV